MSLIGRILSILDNSNNSQRLVRKAYVPIILLFFIFELIQTRVKIISPPELKEMFGGKPLKASLSNFGNIPYGYSIYGKVHFNPDNLDDEMACKNITGINIDPYHDVDDVPIVMIDRGNCHFVTKVRNVESIGGHIALIVNNVKVQDVEAIIMGDDGHGSSVTIPGVLISKEDGEIIKTYYKNNRDRMKDKPIVLEIDFEMETSDNLVSLDFYLESNDFSMLQLLSDIFTHNYFAYLKDSIKFTPRFVTYVHPLYNFTEFNDVKSKDCIAGGRYCASSKDEKITGKDVIKQNLKMKCAFDKSFEGTEDTYYSRFLFYIYSFYRNCCDLTKENYFSESCAAINLQNAGYDIGKINECYANSFSPAGIQNIDLPYTRNKYLDKDNEDKKNNYLKMIPSILINNRTYYGSPNAENIFEAICAGYKKKPEVCYTLGAFTKSSSTFIVLLIIFVVIVINIIIFILCRRYMNRRISDRIQSTDINEKINSVVSNYLALRDQNK